MAKKKQPPTLEQMMDADFAQAFRERPCKNCGQAAELHIHMFGTDVYLCPTVPQFEEKD